MKIKTIIGAGIMSVSAIMLFPQNGKTMFVEMMNKHVAPLIKSSGIDVNSMDAKERAQYNEWSTCYDSMIAVENRYSKLLKLAEGCSAYAVSYKNTVHNKCFDFTTASRVEFEGFACSDEMMYSVLLTQRIIYLQQYQQSKDITKL